MQFNKYTHTHTHTHTHKSDDPVVAEEPTNLGVEIYKFSSLTRAKFSTQKIKIHREKKKGKKKRAIFLRHCHGPDVEREDFRNDKPHHGAEANLPR